MFPGGDPRADKGEYMRTMDSFMSGRIGRGDHDMMADYLFTREITQIKTLEDATTFVNKLWVTLSTNEKRYVLDVYHGRNAAVSNMLIIQEKLFAMRDYIARLERAREAETDHHRSRLAPDVRPAPEPAHVPRSRRFTPLGDLYDDRLSCLVEALESAEAEVASVGPAEVFGGGSDIGRESPVVGIDIRLHKILALCDSLHDFGRKHKAEFQAAVGVEELPEGLNLDVLANEKNAIEFFEGNAGLDFGGGDVSRHALHGRKLLHRHGVADSMKTNHNEYWLAYRQQFKQQDATPSLRSVDLWCLPQFDEEKEKMMPFHEKPPKGHKSVVYMSQIAGIVASIKERFGDGDLTFIMDKSDDQLARLLLATSKLDAAIGRVHIITDDEGARMPAEGEAEPRGKWTFAVCDASMLDGNTHVRTGELPYPNPTVLKDATGRVYPDGFPAYVHFDGVEGDGDDLSVRVTAGGVAHVYDGLVKRRREPESASFDAGDDPEFDDLGRAPFLSSKMMHHVEVGIEHGIDIGGPLAMKRACDWGQVEHCVRHGTQGNRYVFVSKDRIACMYAMYRNVDFVYMTHPTKLQNSAWDTPIILQVTFNMCRRLDRDELREALLGEEPKGGGGSFACHVALSALVVAAAVVGSALRP